MINQLKFLILFFLRRLTNDVLYIRIRYFIIYKRFIDLKNPDTFFAKINWMKLYDRDPKYTPLVDKYEVREYVAERIGKEFLVENYGVYNDPEEIDFDALPNSFVLKATHGAAWNIICEDKAELDKRKAKVTLKKWLKTNFFEVWGEHVYKEVVPRIICEEFLSNKPEPCLIDYKLHCFNGIPTYIQIDRNRFQDHTLDFYDLEWNRMPFGLWFPRSKNDIPKPKPLKKMIDSAGVLAEDFKYVRVDFYVLDDKLYFGELTFNPCNGFGVFEPPSMDYEFGKLLQL